MKGDKLCRAVQYSRDIWVLLQLDSGDLEMLLEWPKTFSLALKRSMLGSARFTTTF